MVHLICGEFGSWQWTFPFYIAMVPSIEAETCAEPAMLKPDLHVSLQQTAQPQHTAWPFAAPKTLWVEFALKREKHHRNVRYEYG